ncbi:MAG: hypothetical protein KF745_03740 [Phycisphaeraceae bacterium]|nr:hypothetical protein [Phycisphaeraceae bacterium]
MNRTTLQAATVIGGVLVLAVASVGQVRISGIEYEKKADRAQTEAAFMARASGTGDITWGRYWLLTPFPGAEKNTLGKSLPPERDLSNMAVNGTGPDLKAHYKGKGGAEVSWRELSDAEGPDNAPIELRVNNSNSIDTNATCYLYRRITAAKPASIEVTMGSDDGLRCWLNGALLVDADVPRGLDPTDHKVRLDLKEGVNHLFAKVSQGGGSWQYQLNNRVSLDSAADAALQWQLNQDFPTPEQEFYKVTTVPIPDTMVLEVGGLDVLPDGRAVVSTRRGDVLIVSNFADQPPINATFKPFATGLHEALGLAVREEKSAGKSGFAVYCVQRGELTRLVDLDGDDRADRYETFCDAWGLSGNYHEFAFGPKFDREGNAWVTLNVGFCGSLGKAIAPYRGWAVKISPEGRMIPVCDGLRSPNGIGMWMDGSMFYADNQGDYVGTNRISLLAPGIYAGHPAGLVWREGWSEGDAPPAREKATIWFPYRKMGQSTADFLVDSTGGRFGPFSDQVFVGDQTNATVMRVDIEKVDGVYQGACFPFFSGLDCGVNRLCFAKDGAMLIGETDRGWASVGRRRFGIQRLEWTGKVPFEPLTMRAAPDGFVLTFTHDVDPKTAGDPGSYSMSSYTYEYHADYGSPEIDHKTPTITRATVTSPRTVRLTVDGLRDGGEGYVHELSMPGVTNKEGRGLLHTEAYYTLQRLPAASTP